MNESNPYQSPAENWKGEYDWSLAYRIMVAVGSLACVYLLCVAIGSWQVFRRDDNHRHEPVLNTIVEFATDWRDGNGLD